jgi:hypothetical protein
MSLGVGISFVATAVAIFALFYSGLSAHAARDSAAAAEEQADIRFGAAVDVGHQADHRNP